MDQTALLTIASTGFSVAFFHAAIPTHWLPFVIASRAQGWSRARTLAVTALAGGGHILFTTLLGVLVAFVGIAVDQWTGDVFPKLAAGLLFAFGAYYLVQQLRGKGGHSHFLGGHQHDHAGHHPADHERADHDHARHDHARHDHARHDHARHDHAGHDHADHGGHEHGGGDHAGHDHGGHDHGSHDHAGHDHGSQDHAGHDHGSHDHAGHHDERASHPAGSSRAVAMDLPPAGPAPARSDRAVILGLLAILTFSPCEGFLPVYVSGIAYGWSGFVLLSVVLAVATLAGMITFTSLTLAGLGRFRLTFVERYESGLLGGLLCFLAVLVLLLES